MTDQANTEEQEPTFEGNLKALTPEQFKQAQDIFHAEETRRDNGNFAKKVANMSQHEFEEMANRLNG